MRAQILRILALTAVLGTWAIAAAKLLPDQVALPQPAQVKVIREDPGKREFIYESDNFRFQANVALSEAVLRQFATVFETTYLYAKALPLGMGEGDRIKGKYLIRIFETEDQFCKAGGSSDSEGVFVPEQKAVLVPVISLGLKKKAGRYELDHGKNQETLIHEVIHQLTPPVYFVKAEDDGWFGEGIAEYLGNTPYQSGRFEPKGNPSTQIEVAVGKGTSGFAGWKIGRSIKAPHLKKFMSMPYDKFTGKLSDFNYGFSILLISYFIHLDGSGDASALKHYLKALAQGKSTAAVQHALLGGRTWQQLEQEFVIRMQQQRISVIFQ